MPRHGEPFRKIVFSFARAAPVKLASLVAGRQGECAQGCVVVKISKGWRCRAGKNSKICLADALLANVRMAAGPDSKKAGTGRVAKAGKFCNLLM
jgi:hypothetical protein